MHDRVSQLCCAGVCECVWCVKPEPYVQVTKETPSGCDILEMQDNEEFVGGRGDMAYESTGHEKSLERIHGVRHNDACFGHGFGGVCEYARICL